MEIEEYLIEKGANDLQSSEEDDTMIRLHRIIDYSHIVFSGNNATGENII